MRKFLFAAVVAVFAIYTACTPKAGTSTAATPPPPVVEPAQWDTLSKPVMGLAEGEEPMEYHTMDTIDVSTESMASSDTLAPYNASHTFEVDLLHTKIEIAFDWAKKHAKAKAVLSMRPWFYPTDRVTLDAKGFDIHSVTMDGKSEALKYEYKNNAELTIYLPKTYNRTEEFRVAIGYTAKPDERTDIGGSAAITSDKGLYFINPDGAETDKPKQIWTQGETESNSCWFPTVDKPNERCTQELYITVEDKYKTLSNGLLVSSKKNADGTRTDYWKMDKPHAPYLFMMAIGEYAVVKDKWRGIDVDYYVEPKYEADARAIYPYTLEMLDFFSNKLNYPYPWSKFSQVVVRDYVSGAMENTTAVIFGEFMQATKRELMEQHLTNEKIVAHEMFHQWFGDLVTTESWANLTMNEGFANYAEYLWLEQKYGRDEADAHEKQEQEGYIFSAAGGGERLIRFGYKNREDMFDAHSYNKGGAVLHMLRNHVGDEAFWTALNRYLRKNEYTEVEAHELRLAFEDVTGQDLNWFFNQWYYGAGHPNLEIVYGWDETTKKANVNIAQTQDAVNGVAYVFDLPLSVDLYDASGKARRERIRVTKRNQSFSFDAPVKPAAINFDAEKALLCVKDDRHTPEEWAFLYRKAPLFRDRMEALEALENQKESALAAAVFSEALNDKYWGIRQKALELADLSTPEAMASVAKMAESDAQAAVRATALRLLGETGDAKYLPIVKKGLDASQAYSVVGAALGALGKLDPKAAIEAAKIFENETNDAIVAQLAEIFAQNPDRASLPFFEKRMGKVDQLGAFAFFDQYQKYLTGLGDDTATNQGIDLLKAIAFDGQTSQWRRFGSTKALADIRNFFREKGSKERVDVLQKLIEEIKEKETDETLKLYYSMF
jgi:aminopeptidase N